MIDDLQISRMRRRDLRRVLRIEQAVFPEPWSTSVFTSEMALGNARAYRVAYQGRTLVGYFGLMFVDDESHVTTLAVAPTCQSRGIGTRLMLHAVRAAIDRGALRLSLEVAAHNDRAQGLYRRFGLAPVGVRRNYYPATGEDALVMCVRDIDSQRYAERLQRIEAQLRCRG